MLYFCILNVYLCETYFYHTYLQDFFLFRKILHLCVMSQNVKCLVGFMIHTLSLSGSVAHFSMNLTKNLAKLLGNNGKISLLKFHIAEKQI